MAEWTGDAGLFALARAELYTAVVGDICDQMGLRKQFLSPAIRAINPSSPNGIMIGRAMTVLEADTFSELDPERPFGKMLEALDDLREHEVYVCAGASPSYALVGELMCVAMRARGAVGAVCDGYIRDTARILEMGFPVYAFGSYAQDQRSRGAVLEYRVPIEIHGVSVHPGDMIMADIDGVIAVPADVVDEVFSRALHKARSENTVRADLADGMPTEAAFAKHGIL